jgi:hypothetical protein
MKNSVVVLACTLLCVSALRAQVPSVAAPLGVDLGIGGGISSPSGTLADLDNTGWNALAKVKLRGWIPLHLTGLVQYNRLPNKGTPAAPGGNDAAWMVGAGLELHPLSAPLVDPYLGVDALVNFLSNSGPASASLTREGLGIGGGVQVSVPMFGSIDGSVKYQMLNLAGKESNESTLSQIAASVTLMFTLF